MGETFIEHLVLIDKTIAAVARRHRLSRTDREDFASTVHVRLLDKDCRALRKFNGHSSLRTFLTVVIERIYLDSQIARRGKWRASATARRLGPIAMQLETLVMRDGLPVAQAIETVQRTLQLNGAIAQSEHELWALASRLPIRHRRRMVENVDLDHLRAISPSPDEGLFRRDAARRLAALARALGRLDAQDRMLIERRFIGQQRIADIARTLARRTRAGGPATQSGG
jgi:RNA polymerase sigma factor (sigma-70 family)